MDKSSTTHFANSPSNLFNCWQHTLFALSYFIKSSLQTKEKIKFVESFKLAVKYILFSLQELFKLLILTSKFHIFSLTTESSIMVLLVKTVDELDKGSHDVYTAL